jgi:hypothetical protein
LENVTTSWAEFNVPAIAFTPYPANAAASTDEDPTPKDINPQVPAAVVFVVI